MLYQSPSVPPVTAILTALSLLLSFFLLLFFLLLEVEVVLLSDLFIILMIY